MDDLIKRQNAVDLVQIYLDRFMKYYDTPEDTELYAYCRTLLTGIVDNFKTGYKTPSVQSERKKAIDIFETVTDHHCEFKCSLCGEEIGEVWLEHSDDFNYCPFCGAELE